MRAIRVATVGLVGLGAWGCAIDDGRISSEEDLSWARSALALGSPREAERHLDRVEASGTLSAKGEAQARLLRAEIHLHKGMPDQALVLADEVAPDETFGAQADEVAGKALIQLARFDEAVVRLEDAVDGYEDVGDLARARDLIGLAEGFGAYASGDPAEARRHWSRIEDASLASSLRSALDAARAAGPTASAR